MSYRLPPTLLACSLVLILSCGGGQSGTPTAASNDPPAAEQQPAADSEPPPATKAVEPPAVPISAKPDPVEPSPATPTESSVVDPGGTIEVAVTKEGLEKIGAAKCKVCHKVQHSSWAESAHAQREPQLDCEGCHGPGSEYKSMSVMKDPEKAAAAGLVEPGREFCSRCHVGEWDETLLARSHAHKE